MTGRFITIEGSDGSGKTTQADLLEKHLARHGEVFRIKFPQYGQPSARLVESYLNGEFGSLQQSVPQLVSLAYAIDRFAAAATIRAKLASGCIVIADRYVASNLAHQAAGMADAAERQAFYEQLKEIEYDILGIPRADINIVLAVPVDIAVGKLAGRGQRTYTSKQRDLHEADQQHLLGARRNYIELCQLYPNEFTSIDCIEDGQLAPIGLISARIWRIVVELLPEYGQGH